MPLVSVIIPIYNVREYLADCIRSVMNQTYPNVECICVDDGSTDGSGKILDEMPESIAGKRLRVVHQANAGVSAARNKALEMAQGEFVTFLDSDDLFELDFIEQAMKDFADDPELDLWVGQVVKTDEKNIASADQPARPPVCETTNVLVDFLRFPGRQYLFSICPKVYRMSVIRANDLWFQVGLKNGEDSLFVTEVFSFLRKARISGRNVYRRRMHGGSAVCRSWAVQVPDALAAIGALMDFATCSPRPWAIRRAVAQRALARFRVAFAQGYSYSFLRDYVVALCGHPLFRRTICRPIILYAPWIYRPMGIVLWLLPRKVIAILMCGAIRLRGVIG